MSAGLEALCRELFLIDAVVVVNGLALVFVFGLIWRSLAVRACDYSSALKRWKNWDSRSPSAVIPKAR